MAGKEIKLGDLCFTSRKDAKSRVREILDETPLHQPLIGEALSVVMGLLRKHPDADEKIGDGVKEIHIRLNKYKSRGFWVVRHDGTAVDFSYRKCFDVPSREAMVKEAMRNAVQPDIDKLRQESKGRDCHISGERLNGGDFDIDHTDPWTFKYLAETWLILMGLTPEEIELEKAVYGRRFARSDLEQQWIQFHRKWARLRAILRSEHRKISRRTSGDCRMA